MEAIKHPNSIKRYRHKFYPRPLTQDDLAELIGVQRNRVSLYEMGVVFPSGQTLFKIAIALNVPTEILYKEFCDEQRSRILELKKSIEVFGSPDRW